jgi:hypothetical protein
VADDETMGRGRLLVWVKMVAPGPVDRIARKAIAEGK